jgi:hypothetical protein
MSYSFPVVFPIALTRTVLPGYFFVSRSKDDVMDLFKFEPHVRDIPSRSQGPESTEHSMYASLSVSLLRWVVLIIFGCGICFRLLILAVRSKAFFCFLSSLAISFLFRLSASITCFDLRRSSNSSSLMDSKPYRSAFRSINASKRALIHPMMVHPKKRLKKNIPIVLLLKNKLIMVGMKYIVTDMAITFRVKKLVIALMIVSIIISPCWVVVIQSLVI